MAQYVFPDSNTQDVCLTQSTTGAVNLIINGNLASGGIVPFINNGYSRQISFTSVNNLSASSFVVTGMQNGVMLSETVTGPNNNTVYSTNIYDVISSIVSSGIVANVSVGSGYSGFFQLISPVISGINGDLNYSFSLGSTFGSNVIGTTVYGTLVNITNNGVTFANLVANNIGTLYQIKAFGNESGYFHSDNTVYSSILIQLTGTTSTIGNTTTLTFLQAT
jgi:hypothetical protein